MRHELVASVVKASISVGLMPVDLHSMICYRFHVDKLSSAHVYLRMHKGQTMEMITPELLEDCAQLVKANSIQGLRLASSSGVTFYVV